MSGNNASGDAVKNSPERNLESSETSQQNNLKDPVKPAQPALSEIVQVAGGDNELKKVTISFVFSNLI